MATKRYRKVNKNKEITYQDIKDFDLNTLSPEDLSYIEQYGLGSWLKKNSKVIGTVATVAGTALSATGIGAGVGAGLLAAGAAATAYGNKYEAQQAQEAQAKQMEANQVLANKTQEFNNETINTYGEVMRNGGTLNYGGQLHEGPNGGVPVDAMGNPNSMNPVALVEKGEVSYNTPDGGTYIYSDTLKYDKNKTFAKKAKDVQRRYKFRMKDGVINDPFAKKSYDNEMLGLMDNQEELRDFQDIQNNINEKELPEAKNGIYIKPENRGKFNATGSTLPPLVKPISDTAAMDEFVNQVEMDYLKMQQDAGNLANNSNPQLYQGMNWAETGLAAAAPVLGGITGLILNNKRKAPVNLKLSRMTPQQINLERRRAAARESAGVATSNLTRSLRNAAPTAGSYMSNVVAGITDIDRNLSNALSESYTQEELQNAQLRQQAETANLDIDMQEQMYNSQLQNQFDASKEAARNAYLSQIGQGITSALDQKFQSSRDADFLNMLNPDYAMAVTGKGLRRRKMILPRTQIGG